MPTPATAPPSVIDFNSGYVMRALETLPRRGKSGPWRLPQNYLRDVVSFRFSSVEDDAMEFKRRPGGAGR